MRSPCKIVRSYVVVIGFALNMISFAPLLSQEERREPDPRLVEEIQLRLQDIEAKLNAVERNDDERRARGRYTDDDRRALETDLQFQRREARRREGDREQAATEEHVRAAMDHLIKAGMQEEANMIRRAAASRLGRRVDRFEEDLNPRPIPPDGPHEPRDMRNSQSMIGQVRKAIQDLENRVRNSEEIAQAVKEAHRQWHEFRERADQRMQELERHIDRRLREFEQSSNERARDASQAIERFEQMLHEQIERFAQTLHQHRQESEDEKVESRSDDEEQNEEEKEDEGDEQDDEEDEDEEDQDQDDEDEEDEEERESRSAPHVGRGARFV